MVCEEVIVALPAPLFPGEAVILDLGRNVRLFFVVFVKLEIFIKFVQRHFAGIHFLIPRLVFGGELQELFIKRVLLEGLALKPVLQDNFVKLLEPEQRIQRSSSSLHSLEIFI